MINMKNLFRISGVILVVLSIFLIHSCKKEKPTPTPPIITTTAASAITQTTATSGGNVTSDGGAAVTARGVCWSTSANPTIALSTKTSDNTGTGIFSSSITALTAGTVYYVKAYATNSAGTAYGNEISFTSTASTVPVLTTTAASAITQTTATSGGNITSDGGATVTARGVCWSTSANPTTALSTKTTDNTGTGIFTSSITGLTAGTVYYIRAYATNSTGTAYGTQISFTTTSATVPVLTTTTASAITQTTATSGGNITSDGGATVTARGVCWSTTSGPTTALSTKTTDNTGTGVFTSSINGLTAGTDYYVKAYATNSAGTAYGNEISFTSTASTVPVLTTTAASLITQTTASSGGNITSDGGATVTARGVCWSTSANPITALSTKTTDNTGIGVFASSITALTAGTTYYVRAYATNSAGTAYGIQRSFTTMNLPTLTTTTITAITQTTVTSGGNITSNGGASITARGVCWSTSSNPTIEIDSKTTDGAGTGIFSSSLTGLTAGTLYYVRAYATYSAGTAYGNEVSFKTYNSDAIQDIEGNYYNIVTIGSQVWMKDNLNTTKYNDGISIPTVTGYYAWSNLSTPAYCSYVIGNNNYKDIYGALYNWYTVSTAKICPSGWHVPTNAEWTTLTDYLGGLSLAGSKLKETGTTHWLTPNTGATNETGFTALPGGVRGSNGFFDTALGSRGCWWSNYATGPTTAFSRSLYYNSGGVEYIGYEKRSGFSIRCVKD